VSLSVPAKEVRPPLPKGPFLVVGLARSGQAAARMLAARGERVRAVDSGHPGGAAGLEGAGVEVFLDTDGLAQLEGTGTEIEAETTVEAGVALHRCQIVRGLRR
jgi:nucleoside-diphosphate-sugar epimerase